MIRVVATVVIERALEDVFDYVKEPNNQLHWQPGLHEVRHREGTSIGGSVTEVRKVLGRRVEHTLEIVEFEENVTIFSRGTASTHEGSMEHRLTFEELGPATTRLTLELGIDAGTALRAGEPILHRMLQRQSDSNLQHLKDLMEAHEDLHAAAARLPPHQPQVPRDRRAP